MIDYPTPVTIAGTDPHWVERKPDMRFERTKSGGLTHPAPAIPGYVPAVPSPPPQEEP